MRDLFQVVFELKQKEIDDAYKKMDKDKRVMTLALFQNLLHSFSLFSLEYQKFNREKSCRHFQKKVGSSSTMYYKSSGTIVALSFDA